MPVKMLPPPTIDRRRMAQLDRMIFGGKRRAKALKPVEHGTRYAYVHHECRCEECREANREYQRANIASQPATVPNHLHGKPDTYNRRGCRCADCRRAATAYRMQYLRSGHSVLTLLARRAGLLRATDNVL